MSRGKQVQGFDYTTGKQVSMTAAEWRAKYPAANHLRRVQDGETHYFELTAYHGIGGVAVSKGPRVAEAYAIIPEGK